MNWYERAECRNTHPDIFFLDHGASHWDTLPARATCARCTVRQDCLDYALAETIMHGIWGGMSVNERLAERARRNRAKKNGMAA